uniref:Uncharacterized protein n=2 Tax=unclassified Caudoviricetes TaxID=2788787 RepID=A0A8S5UN29_9CAUD|nr:MAG TPA: hypothetical protein [Siphoviridae sp. ctsus30]DAF95835.1 MAG TPA: hypothetical protein [Siphoviridae sp. ctKGQ3]
MHNLARAGVIGELVNAALASIGTRDSHTHGQVSVHGVCVTAPFAGKLCIEKVAQVMWLKIFLCFTVSDLGPPPARGTVLGPFSNNCVCRVSHFLLSLSVCVCCLVEFAGIRVDT